MNLLASNFKKEHIFLTCMVFITVTLTCVLAFIFHKVMFYSDIGDKFYYQIIIIEKHQQSWPLSLVHYGRYIVSYPFYKSNNLLLAPVLHSLLLGVLFTPLATMAWSKGLRLNKLNMYIKYTFIILFLPLCVMSVSIRTILCMFGVGYLYLVIFGRDNSKYLNNTLFILSLALCNLSSGCIAVFLGVCCLFYNKLLRKLNILVFGFSAAVALISFSISLNSKFQFFQSMNSENNLNLFEFYLDRSKFSESLARSQTLKMIKYGTLSISVFMILIFEFFRPLPLLKNNQVRFFILFTPLIFLEGLGVSSFSAVVAIYYSENIDDLVKFYIPKLKTI